MATKAKGRVGPGLNKSSFAGSQILISMPLGTENSLVPPGVTDIRSAQVLLLLSPGTGPGKQS